MTATESALPATLADLDDAQRLDYIGMWCQVGDLVGIYEGPYLGARIKLPQSSWPAYADEELVKLRYDLPRAWNPDGTPPVQEDRKSHA